MRHVYLILAGGVAVLLLGMGLLFVYDRAGYDLALPDATDIQLDGPVSARQQQIAYHLPPNQSLDDVYKHLESKGWSHDERAKEMMRRDSMIHTESFGAFTRQRLFGALSEIAIVKLSLTNRREVEIRVFRCFRLFSPNECFWPQAG